MRGWPRQPPLRLFIYGTLCDPDLFRVVAGSPMRRFRPALGRAWGMRSLCVFGAAMPLLKRGSGSVRGLLLYGLDARAWQRMCFYEDVEYKPAEIRVQLNAKRSVKALTFAPSPALTPTRMPWSMAHWRLSEKRRPVACAQRYMRYADARPETNLNAVWQAIQQEVAA